VELFGAQPASRSAALFWKAVKRKTRTEITLETDEVFVVKFAADGDFAWCAECKKQVRTLTVDQAAAIGGRKLAPDLLPC
jgi:hypothetical protein